MKHAFLKINPAPFFICLLTVAVTACIQLDPLASERLADGAAASATIRSSDPLDPGSPSRVDEANRHSARMQAERDEDERRLAAGILKFFAIKPGMAVLELYSGRDYYTELLAFIVGPAGRVVVHENMPYLSFAQNELAARTVDEQLDSAKNYQLALAPNVFDAAIMIKSYRDEYFVSEDSGWVKIDRPDLLREIFAALRPGGVLGIVDYADDPAVRAESGETLRRVDPAVIKRDMAAAGFIFDEENDVMRDISDDYSQSVFATSDRDQVDRIVLRFRKPRSEKINFTQ